jgi:hypothetical protein
MLVRFLALVLFIPLLIPQMALSQEAYGPMPVRNFAPAQMIFLGMEMERAELLIPRQWNLGLTLVESNSLQEDSNPDIRLWIDLETTSAFLSFDYGLMDRLEIGVEVPMVYRHGGFIDPFSFWIEDLASRVNPLRESVPDNQLTYYVRFHDVEILSGEEGAGLGNILLQGKYRWISEGDWHPLVSWRGVLKLPTGDRVDAFGSDTTDLGIGLLAEKKKIGPLILYGNLNEVVPIGNFEPDVVPIRPFFTAGVAIEYPFLRRASFVGQFQYYDSPYDNPYVKRLDTPTYEVVPGFHIRIGRSWLWSLGAVQNIVTEEAAADFSFFTRFQYRGAH